MDKIMQSGKWNKAKIHVDLYFCGYFKNHIFLKNNLKNEGLKVGPEMNPNNKQYIVMDYKNRSRRKKIKVGNKASEAWLWVVMKANIFSVGKSGLLLAIFEKYRYQIPVGYAVSLLDIFSVLFFEVWLTLNYSKPL